jgi:hypothetical protein
MLAIFGFSGFGFFSFQNVFFGFELDPFRILKVQCAEEPSVARSGVQ